MMNGVDLALLVTLMSAGALGYAEGPPVATNSEICTDLTPQHGTNAKPNDADTPFEVKTVGTCYKQGLDVPVYIRVRDNETVFPYFEGFFAMVRTDAGGNAVNYGAFTIDDAEQQTLDCFDRAASAVGHNAHDHWGCKTATWRAPESFQEDVFFIGTVVKNELNFWVGLKSANLQYDANCVIDSAAMDAQCASEECTRNCDAQSTTSTTTTTTESPTNGGQKVHRQVTPVGLGVVVAVLLAIRLW